MIELSNEFIRAQINPFGAELTVLNKINETNVLWNKNEDFWNRIAPNLFPIVGRLKNDSYMFEDKTYSLTQHGFARDCSFEVLEKKESAVVLRLLSNDLTKINFPFEFSLEIHFVLNHSAIEITYLVENRGVGILPYSIGGHPGFSIVGNLNDYFLDFELDFSADQWLLEGSFYSGETKQLSVEKVLNLDYEMFKNDAIVFKSPAFKQVILSHKAKGRILSLSSDSMTAIGFWTKSNAPFICIEPWWGWADKHDFCEEITKKEGIQLLNRNESNVHSYSINLF